MVYAACLFDGWDDVRLLAGPIFPPQGGQNLAVVLIRTWRFGARSEPSFAIPCLVLFPGHLLHTRAAKSRHERGRSEAIDSANPEK